MSPKSTVVKAELQVSDMDRHYYGMHNLTLAQHPSENEERLMVRLLTFALLADERLEFGRGLSDESEPDLWRRDYTGEIEQWVDLGQPDEADIRRASGRARQVVIVTYSGNSAQIWWEKNAAGLSRLKNLTVIDIPADAVASLVALYQRSMRLNCLIQDAEVQLMNEADSIALRPVYRMTAAATA
ncbi:YaeQ family protein [Lysobacter korlensis]|uniref:YaeQ family protein n=1 Tax=Lysobacter korlensis TaxID=553636 RepID=A0ABV6RKZ2_9GAMM